MEVLDLLDLLQIFPHQNLSIFVAGVQNQAVGAVLLVGGQVLLDAIGQHCHPAHDPGGLYFPRNRQLYYFEILGKVEGTLTAQDKKVSVGLTSPLLIQKIRNQVANRHQFNPKAAYPLVKNQLVLLDIENKN